MPVYNDNLIITTSGNDTSSTQTGSYELTVDIEAPFSLIKWDYTLTNIVTFDASNSLGGNGTNCNGPITYEWFIYDESANELFASPASTSQSSITFDFSSLSIETYQVVCTIYDPCFNTHSYTINFVPYGLRGVTSIADTQTNVDAIELVFTANKGTGADPTTGVDLVNIDIYLHDGSIEVVDSRIQLVDQVWGDPIVWTDLTDVGVDNPTWVWGTDTLTLTFSKNDPVVQDYNALGLPDPSLAENLVFEFKMSDEEVTDLANVLIDNTKMSNTAKVTVNKVVDVENPDNNR